MFSEHLLTSYFYQLNLLDSYLMNFLKFKFKLEKDVLKFNKEILPNYFSTIFNIKQQIDGSFNDKTLFKLESQNEVLNNYHNQLINIFEDFDVNTKLNLESNIPEILEEIEKITHLLLVDKDSLNKHLLTLDYIIAYKPLFKKLQQIKEINNNVKNSD